MSNWFSPPMNGELSLNEINKMADEGKFHEWNFEPFESQENGYEDVLDEIKKYRAVDYLALDDQRKKAVEAGETAKAKEIEGKMDKMVDDVLKIYREKDILPIQYFSDFGIVDEIEKCISYKAKFDGNTVSCGAGIGTTLCNYLFPNIFDTPSAHDLEKTNARSLYEKFHNDEYLKRAIKFCYSYKDGCPVPTNVMGGLRLVGSAPTNFRPMNAKAVYERFCPDGGVIYDFCCVSGDTEFFCGDGWKPISEYTKGDKVLQYNEDGTAEMVKPEEYIHYKNSEPFYEYENEEFASCLTGNHDVVYGSYDGIHKIKQSEILDGFEGRIPITCEFGSKERVYSDKDMIIMATHFVSMSKDDLSLYKQFCRDLYGMSYYDKCRFIESVFKGTDTWFTLNKMAADIVNTLCRMVGYYSVTGNDRIAEDIYYVERDITGCKNTSKYLVNEKYSFKKVEQEDKYCFVVPSHMLVLRYKGKMFITGNCGFGGRMLGALSSKKNFRYVGTDPCTETMYHLHQLGDYIEMVTGKEDSYELHCCGSEDFRGPENSIDFAFSSPPYFNLEVYSDEETQCYNKFPELEQWLEGYVRQTIKNIHHMLKPGALYAVNIADFKVGSGREVAYVDEWKRISAEEGMPLFDTVYLGVTSRAGSAEQAAGELKKENIMIFKKPLRYKRIRYTNPLIIL